MVLQDELQHDDETYKIIYTTKLSSLTKIDTSYQHNLTEVDESVLYILRGSHLLKD